LLFLELNSTLRCPHRIEVSLVNILAIPSVRERICRLRFSILKRTHGIKQGTNNGVLHLDYSKSHFGSYLSFKGRVNYLVQTVNSLLIAPKSEQSILSIGPRFESELFGYRGLGLKWPKIVGLDTFSYSPKIQVGNMHSSPFDSDIFDIIVCGWTIAYSATPVVAFLEFSRLLKPSGKIIITWDLPGSFQVTDPSSLTLNRKLDIDDAATIFSELPVLELISPYLEVYRFEVGKLPFNNETPFATLILQPRKTI